MAGRRSHVNVQVAILMLHELCQFCGNLIHFLECRLTASASLPVNFMAVPSSLFASQVCAWYCEHAADYASSKQALPGTLPQMMRPFSSDREIYDVGSTVRCKDTGQHLL